jgi:hypothetical protein
MIEKRTLKTAFNPVQLIVHLLGAKSWGGLPWCSLEGNQGSSLRMGGKLGLVQPACATSTKVEDK